MFNGWMSALPLIDIIFQPYDIFSWLAPRAVAYRGSPAPGGQWLHRPPPPELAFPPGEKIDKENKKKVFGKKKKRKSP